MIFIPQIRVLKADPQTLIAGLAITGIIQGNKSFARLLIAHLRGSLNSAGFFTALKKYGNLLGGAFVRDAQVLRYVARVGRFTFA